MKDNQPIYEIERANRVENTKSALAGLVVGGLLTAGTLLLLGPLGAKQESAGRRNRHSGRNRAPGNGHKQAGR